MKVLDFDKDTDENAQFSVAFPKSWNEGTVTFQAFFGLQVHTNTGTTTWFLAGVARLQMVMEILILHLEQE